MERDSEQYSVLINTEKTSDKDKRLIESLSQKIVGQPRAIKHITGLMVLAKSGLRDPHRPIGIMVFAGPTSCGKSLTAKELAKTLFDYTGESAYPLTIVQCANLPEHHQIATLIGSPPGYVDSHKIPLLHRFNIEKYALMSFLKRDIYLCRDEMQKRNKRDALEQVKRCLQSLSIGQKYLKHNKQNLNAYNFLDEVFRKTQPLTSVILFDEIEKAHPDIWNLLLGIIGDGELQLANNNEITSFANSLVILTTNTGSREIQGLLSADRIGFKVPTKDEDQNKLDQAIYNEAKKALEKIFLPEMMSRIGKNIIAFRSLKKEDYNQIFLQLVDDFRRRLDRRGISMEYTEEFRRLVVEDGFSQKYGPRILIDSVEKYIETPISFGLSSGELQKRDRIMLAINNGRPVLLRQSRSTFKQTPVGGGEKEQNEQC